MLSPCIAPYCGLLREKKYKDAIIRMLDDHGQHVEIDLVMTMLLLIPSRYRIENLLFIASKGRLDILKRFYHNYGFSGKDRYDIEHFFGTIEIEFGDILTIYTIRMMVSFLSKNKVIDVYGIDPYYIE